MELGSCFGAGKSCREEYHLGKLVRRSKVLFAAHVHLFAGAIYECRLCKTKVVAPKRGALLKGWSIKTLWKIETILRFRKKIAYPDASKAEKQVVHARKIWIFVRSLGTLKA